MHDVYNRRNADIVFGPKPSQFPEHQSYVITWFTAESFGESAELLIKELPRSVGQARSILWQVAHGLAELETCGFNGEIRDLHPMNLVVEQVGCSTSTFLICVFKNLNFILKVLGTIFYYRASKTIVQ